MLDLSQLDLSQFPDRPEGSDRIVSVIVIDRPDPVGADADVSQTLSDLSAPYLAAVCETLGTTPDQLNLANIFTNTETVVEGPSEVVNGADIVAAATPDEG